MTPSTTFNRARKNDEKDLNAQSNRTFFANISLNERFGSYRWKGSVRYNMGMYFELFYFIFNIFSI